jgi:hypothetical protein
MGYLMRGATVSQPSSDLMVLFVATKLQKATRTFGRVTCTVALMTTPSDEHGSTESA